MYNGYNFGGQEIYNPWSIINYAKTGLLLPAWVNTSSNTLIHKLIKESRNDKESSENFNEKFESLIMDKEVKVSTDLETSFFELKNPATFILIFRLILRFLKLKSTDFPR